MIYKLILLKADVSLVKLEIEINTSREQIQTWSTIRELADVDISE